MLFSAGQQGTLTMMISSLLIMRPPQPSQMGKLPDGFRVPFVFATNSELFSGTSQVPLPLPGNRLQEKVQRILDQLWAGAACLIGDGEQSHQGARRPLPGPQCCAGAVDGQSSEASPDPGGVRRR